MDEESMNVVICREDMLHSRIISGDTSKKSEIDTYSDSKSRSEFKKWRFTYCWWRLEQKI